MNKIERMIENILEVLLIIGIAMIPTMGLLVYALLLKYIFFS